MGTIYSAREYSNYRGREAHLPSPDAISAEALATTSLAESNFLFLAALTLMAHSVVRVRCPPLQYQEDKS